MTSVRPTTASALPVGSSELTLNQLLADRDPNDVGRLTLNANPQMRQRPFKQAHGRRLGPGATPDQGSVLCMRMPVAEGLTRCSCCESFLIVGPEARSVVHLM